MSLEIFWSDNSLNEEFFGQKADVAPLFDLKTTRTESHGFTVFK